MRSFTAVILVASVVTATACGPKRATTGPTVEVLESFAAVDMRLEESRLVFDAVGQPAVRVHASGPATFISKNPRFDLAVELGDDGGPARGITVSQGGLAVDYARDDRGTKKARKR